LAFLFFIWEVMGLNLVWRAAVLMGCLLFLALHLGIYWVSPVTSIVWMQSCIYRGRCCSS